VPRRARRVSLSSRLWLPKCDAFMNARDSVWEISARKHAFQNATKGTSNMTTSADLIDRAFQSIMRTMVRSGNAPDHIELAAELGLEPDEGLEVLQNIMLTGYPGWLDENDVIVTICPFSNVPNELKITVDGEGKWFGQ